MASRWSSLPRPPDSGQKSDSRNEVPDIIARYRRLAGSADPDTPSPPLLPRRRPRALLGACLARLDDQQGVPIWVPQIEHRRNRSCELDGADPDLSRRAHTGDLVVDIDSSRLQLCVG